MTDDPEARREGIRALWAAGSYAAVGDRFASIGAGLVDELDVDGRVVLDAACGTGNTTLALARAGARVTGVDLTPALLAEAGRRATEAGLDVELVEGDLLDLPFGDDAFELVTSTFGAYVVDDPFGAAAELARVCRPGGTIALTSWGSPGLFTPIREAARDLAPELVPDGPTPDDWAEREHLEHRFAHTSAEVVDVEDRWHGFRFPSLDAGFDFFLANSGPLMALHRAADALGVDAGEIRRRTVASWRELATEVDGEVEVRARWSRALLRVS